MQTMIGDFSTTTSENGRPLHTFLIGFSLSFTAFLFIYLFSHRQHQWLVTQITTAGRTQHHLLEPETSPMGTQTPLHAAGSKGPLASELHRSKRVNRVVHPFKEFAVIFILTGHQFCYFHSIVVIKQRKRREVSSQLGRNIGAYMILYRIPKHIKNPGTGGNQQSQKRKKNSTCSSK